ncbi:F-box protein At3g07870 [Eucalyptus grandis]|uniref:F-box protein At3g07870 n=1 Tax=Eucalyptus grandis TaxID=71139 RepID=UPI00192E8422|nr:F-box protein At3g07870 [Eucalyptus grandis]
MALAYRSNRVRSSSGDDPKLPHDAVVEILKRLPVGSLLRFRCVCRSWRSTIDDPDFVAHHLSHSALDASNGYLLCLDWDEGDDPVRYSLFSSESLTRPSMSQIEIPFAASSKRFGFVGSCNGLICVREMSGDGYARSMYLWNLFTRKHRAVRRSSLDSKFRSIYNVHVAVGFGFDARSNDYKILRILYFPDDINLVEVYSLSTDSWRSLECEVPAFCAYSPSVFLNGNLHWLVSKNDDLWTEGWSGSIVLFDVASEVFDEMALSKEFLQVLSISKEVVLSALNNLLAVCTVHGEAVGHPQPHSVCSVWVMRDYGVPESWTKLYSFEACGQVTGFDGFMRNGELLMLIDDDEGVSWNPITGQFTILPLSRQSDLVTIIESLVSP